uniref:Uncharacterized protein n=1 Tax=Arundo donax TaxID=35708 RepID=A0A0A9F881_ARUDO
MFPFLVSVVARLFAGWCRQKTRIFPFDIMRFLLFRLI